MKIGKVVQDRAVGMVLQSAALLHIEDFLGCVVKRRGRELRWNAGDARAVVITSTEGYEASRPGDGRAEWLSISGASDAA